MRPALEMRKTWPILVVAAAAMFGNGAKAADPVVTLQTNPGVLSPVEVIMATGLCPKHGLQCKSVITNSTPLAVQALIGGSVDAIYGSTDVIIQAAIKGNDLKLTWGEQYTNPFFVAAASTYSLPNLAKGYPAVMADFRGAKIGVSARGASTEAQFVTLLQGAGMTASDVTFVAVGGQSTALVALRSRQVDAVMTWEPAGLICVQEKSCQIAVDLRKDEGPKLLTALKGAENAGAMRADFIKKNPETAKAMLAVFKEADEWIHDPKNFNALLDILKNIMKIPNQQNLEQIQLDYLKGTILPGLSVKLDRKAVQANADYLFETKQAAVRFDTSKIIWDEAPQP